jgi:hypothetical protein
MKRKIKKQIKEGEREEHTYTKRERGKKNRRKMIRGE